MKKGLDRHDQGPIRREKQQVKETLSALQAHPQLDVDLSGQTGNRGAVQFGRQHG